jgi:hypothetical protein
MYSNGDKMYSIVLNNGIIIEDLNYAEVMSYDITMINSIHKYYQKINRDGTYDNCLTMITLYVAEIPMTPEQYINNYRNLTNMYGLNAIETNDIVIIEKFNKY